MEIREAVYSDLEGVAQLGRLFFDDTPFAKWADYDEEFILGNLVALTDSPTATIIVAYDGDEMVGITGAVLAASWMVPDHLTGSELFWYVEPEYRRTKVGKRMFSHLETWAKNQGADTFSMVALATKHEKRVSAMYEAKGYTAQERVFTKEL